MAAPRLAINDAIKKRHLSKRLLARELGIAYYNVFRIFRPGFNPTFKTLVKLSKIIGCKVSDLIKE